MKAIVRALSDLGPDLTFAPERHLAARIGDAAGLTLGGLCVERNERVVGDELARAVVLDTTHAKDGVLDVHAARASSAATSPKKRVRDGDVLVSRLRPYLRQIALVHPSAIRAARGATLACSTEFYVLSPRPGDDLAYFLPLLLGAGPQAALAAGQEGGHHPRVPKETVLGLRVDRRAVGDRARSSRAVRVALAAVYAATEHYRRLLR